MLIVTFAGANYSFTEHCSSSIPGKQRRSHRSHVPLWSYNLFYELPLASSHGEYRAAIGWLWENSGNAVWRRKCSKYLGSWVSRSDPGLSGLFLLYAHALKSFGFGVFIHNFYFKWFFQPWPWILGGKDNLKDGGLFSRLFSSSFKLHYIC